MEETYRIRILYCQPLQLHCHSSVPAELKSFTRWLSCDL